MPEVRALQRMVLSGKLAVAESLVLRSAVAESSIGYDSAGNPELDKPGLGAELTPCRRPLSRQASGRW